MDISPSTLDATQSDGTAAGLSPVPPARQHRSSRGRDLALVLAASLLSAGLASTATTTLDRNATASSATAGTGATTTTAAGSATTAIASASGGSAVSAAAAVSPAVVTITTTTSLGPGPFASGESVGSGFVYGADGLILTNAHVVEGASALTVTLADGRTFDGTVVASDTTLDLAVVKIVASGLPTAALASTAPAVGTTVLAIGDPLGQYAGTVTIGVVSATDRSITVADQQTRTTHDLSGLIQTDAAINEGNSGGPLVNLSGAVLGVVTAGGTSSEGIGFAIPIEAATAIMAQARSAIQEG